MVPGQTCSNCHAFAVLEGNQCRKESPKAFLMPGPNGPQVLGAWPFVMPTHWCTQWVQDPSMQDKTRLPESTDQPRKAANDGAIVLAT